MPRWLALVTGFYCAFAVLVWIWLGASVPLPQAQMDLSAVLFFAAGITAAQRMIWYYLGGQPYRLLWFIVYVSSGIAAATVVVTDVQPITQLTALYFAYFAIFSVVAFIVLPYATGVVPPGQRKRHAVLVTLGGIGAGVLAGWLFAITPASLPRFNVLTVILLLICTRLSFRQPTRKLQWVGWAYGTAALGAAIHVLAPRFTLFGDVLQSLFFLMMIMVFMLEVAEQGIALEDRLRRIEMDAAALDLTRDLIFLVADGKLQFANQAAKRYLQRHAGYVDLTVSPAWADVASLDSMRALLDVPVGNMFTLPGLPDRQFVKDLRGSPERFTLHVRDVTEGRLLEQSLTLAQSELAIAHLAHEIRNPLQVIMGFAQVVAKRESLSDEGQWQLGMVQEEGRRIQLLVDDLLVYSAHVTLERKRLSLQEVFAMACHETGHPVHISGYDVVVYGSRHRLLQVFANLLRNAREASPTVACRVALRANQGAAEMEIRNPGHVPDAILHQVWMPFVTSKVNGTGLGLSIARKIVFQHGGTISLHNEGEEVVVRVTLPYAAGKPIAMLD